MLRKCNDIIAKLFLFINLIYFLDCTPVFSAETMKINANTVYEGNYE